jgi:hypothetical protein
VVVGVGKLAGQHVVETNGESLVECADDSRPSAPLHRGGDVECVALRDPVAARPRAGGGERDSRGPKSDERDAFALAHQVGAAELAQLPVRPQILEDPLVRGADDKGTEAKFSCAMWGGRRIESRALLRSRGVSVEGKTIYGAEGRQKYVDQLPDGTRAEAATLFAQYDALQEIRKQ